MSIREPSIHISLKSLKLQPCPFCGEKVRLHAGLEAFCTYQAKCLKCGAQSRAVDISEAYIYLSQDEEPNMGWEAAYKSICTQLAVNHWNTRNPVAKEPVEYVTDGLAYAPNSSQSMNASAIKNTEAYQELYKLWVELGKPFFFHNNYLAEGLSRKDQERADLLLNRVDAEIFNLPLIVNEGRLAWYFSHLAMIVDAYEEIEKMDKEIYKL